MIFLSKSRMKAAVSFHPITPKIPPKSPKYMTEVRYGIWATCMEEAMKRNHMNITTTNHMDIAKRNDTDVKKSYEYPIGNHG